MRRTRELLIAWLAGLLCWLVAGTSVGSELSTSDQAEDLCSTALPFVEPLASDRDSRGDPLLAALRRHEYAVTRYHRLFEVFQVTLDTQDYRFLPSRTGSLAVDTLEPILLFGGSHELDLGQTLDLTFILSEPRAAEVQAGYLSDQVLLKLYFQLISLEDPGVPYCVTTAAGNVRIIGRLLAADLVTRPPQQVLAHFETERHLFRTIRLGLNGNGQYIVPRPRVLVTDEAFPSFSPPTIEADLLRLEAETAAIPCYVSGLNLNGRLQGAVVVSSRIDAGGNLQEPVVTIDALNQPLLTGCLLGVLGEITLPRTQALTPYEVRMNFIFRLE